jgi:hypothetical protein
MAKVVVVLGVHVTCTPVTLSVAVPMPLFTVHVSPVGCVDTDTEYDAPLFTGVLNVNEVAFAATEVSLPPLFCKTNPAAVRPETVPLMVNVFGFGVVVPELPPPQAERDNNAAIRNTGRKNFITISVPMSVVRAGKPLQSGS